MQREGIKNRKQAGQGERKRKKRERERERERESLQASFLRSQLHKCH